MSKFAARNAPGFLVKPIIEHQGLSTEPLTQYGFAQHIINNKPLGAGGKPIDPTLAAMWVRFTRARHLQQRGGWNLPKPEDWKRGDPIPNLLDGGEASTKILDGEGSSLRFSTPTTNPSPPSPSATSTTQQGPGFFESMINQFGF
jgi:hypothetical protein